VGQTIVFCGLPRLRSRFSAVDNLPAGIAPKKNEWH
jgi:hypothetical protein